MYIQFYDETGKVFAIHTLEPKIFKSGSEGYFVTFKAYVEGVKYQFQVQAVRVRSKPNEGEANLENLPGKTK